MAYGEKMFYVVSKALGEAMLQGRKNPPQGTIYGIYKTKERAEEALRQRKVMAGKGTEKFPIIYGMIVEQ